MKSSTFLYHLGANLTTKEGPSSAYGKGNGSKYLTTEGEDNIYIGYCGFDFCGNPVRSIWDGDFERDCKDGNVIWTLDTAGGNDYVKIRDDQNAYTVTKLGEGDDVYDIGGTLDANYYEAINNDDARAYVFTEEGNDKVTIRNTVDGGRIFTGSGSDDVTIHGEVDDGGVIDLGSGNTTYANGHTEANVADDENAVNNLHITGSLGECSANDYGIVLGGRGKDNVIIDHEIEGKSKIDLGNNEDNVSVAYMQHDSQIITGNDNDTVNVRGSIHNDSMIDTSGVTLDNSGPEPVFKDDDDVVNIGYSTTGNSQIITGDGQDTINIGDDVDCNSSISAGKGDDVLNIGDDIENTASVDMGNGNNTINVASQIGGFSSLMAGDGDDTLDVGYAIATHAKVNLGDGNNTINVGDDVDGYSNVITGNGNDTLNIGDDTEDGSKINLGDGNNVINIADNMEDCSSIITGNGDDELNISGSMYNKASVNLGDGDDIASVGVGVYCRSLLEGGEGDDTLELVYNENSCMTSSWKHVTNLSTENISGFETIKMEGRNAVDIRYSDLLEDDARDGALFIEGNENCKVDLGSTNWNSDSSWQAKLDDATGGTWSQTTTQTIDNITYDVYHHSYANDDSNDVYIQQGITII